ncbi:MAG: HAMP domain-containing histidine kinase [Devosiaceae bacterium]|nr:HAMP domain-containing histidine kinase [Devosiaceae bacterium]
MQKGSIAARLFWLSAAWLVVALIATGLLLSELYSRALERSQAETLNFNLITLVERSVEAGTPTALGVQAPNPRFNRSGSGWYWQITNPEGELLNLSNSLVGESFSMLDETYDENNSRVGNAMDDAGRHLKVIERKVEFQDTQLIVTVAGNLDDIAQLTGQFRNQAFVVLGAVGVMLAIMSAIVARVALRPVGRLARAIERVRSGEAQKVEGNYPQELTPLAGELNELLRSNTQIVQRAKSQVGNLAHGLKTPLAVLQNEAEISSKKLPVIVKSEVKKMNSQVKIYLDRAQMSARSAIVGSRANTGEVIARLVRVMQKLHCERKLSVKLEGNHAIWFRGEESDLEEIVGNLLDNACKWSAKEIKILVGTKRLKGQKFATITIEDDGAGLSELEAESVLRRGVRLDEKTAGSGLGLDIVKELVDIYGGQLKLDRSTLGGLRANILLPTTR